MSIVKMKQCLTVSHRGKKVFENLLLNYVLLVLWIPNRPYCSLLSAICYLKCAKHNLLWGNNEKTNYRAGGTEEKSIPVKTVDEYST